MTSMKNSAARLVQNQWKERKYWTHSQTITLFQRVIKKSMTSIRLLVITSKVNKMRPMSRTWSVWPWIVRTSQTAITTTPILISLDLKVPSKYMTMHRLRDSSMSPTSKRSIIKQTFASKKNANRQRTFGTSSASSLAGKRRSKTSLHPTMSNWKRRTTFKT